MAADRGGTSSDIYIVDEAAGWIRVENRASSQDAVRRDHERGFTDARIDRRPETITNVPLEEEQTDRRPSSTEHDVMNGSRHTIEFAQIGITQPAGM